MWDKARAMLRTTLAVAVTVAATVAGALGTAAWAGDDTPIGFQSPSGNIHCLFDVLDDRRRFLRCDLRRIDGPLPPRPADCPLDWGLAFVLPDARAPAERICVGDTTVSPELPVLAYGQVWRMADITCTVVETGMTCTNAHGHGFVLSRAVQRLF